MWNSGIRAWKSREKLGIREFEYEICGLVREIPRLECEIRRREYEICGLVREIPRLECEIRRIECENRRFEFVDRR
jgi:uncharacterized small protein (DUF1192 family)